MQTVNIIEVEHTTDRLFKIKTTRPDTFRFQAGEFVMLGLDGVKPKRAYSITSGPYDPYIEFYSIKVPEGEFTTPLSKVQVGDEILLGNKPTGTLTLSNVELGGDLWLLATGTGIAPFISLLRDPETLQSFDTVHVVWSVRRCQDLEAYREFLENSNINFVPTVTQEPFHTQARIQKLIADGCVLQEKDPRKHKVMLCGSIEFNRDIEKTLSEYGWTTGSSKTQGTLVQERAFVG